MNVVLDANVVIAAFASRGLCEGVFEYCVQNCDVFLCQGLIDEIRGKLTSKIKLSAKHVDEIIAYLNANCVIAVPIAIDASACRDPDDLKVLGLAKSVEADYIVTGDKDLLTIVEFEGTMIASPRRFSELISM